MAESRDFSQRPGFGPYSYEERETQHTYTSPFPVAVIGIDDEVLGVGQLLGATSDGGWDQMPVIAIEDDQAPGGVMEILGVECWWTPQVDDELTAVLAQGEIGRNIVRVSAYVKKLDAVDN